MSGSVGDMMGLCSLLRISTPLATVPGLRFVHSTEMPVFGTVGYAPGCVYSDVTGHLFVNHGTAESCNFLEYHAATFAKVGYFACPSSTGNYSVTDLGFKPKTIEFIGSKNDGWQTWFFLSDGFADDAGNQNVSTLVGNFSNLFRGDCAFDKCIYLRNTAGAIQVMGTLVSMDNDGFTLNFTNTNSIFVVRWKAIG